MAEGTLRIQAEPDRINLLHSLAPTLDGLFSVTVSGGRTGYVALFFDARRREEVVKLCKGFALTII